jgi:hypothetical protein
MLPNKETSMPDPDYIVRILMTVAAVIGAAGMAMSAFGRFIDSTSDTLTKFPKLMLAMRRLKEYWTRMRP